MASEWIKMRADLYTHPRFVSLVRQLIHDARAGLIFYVIQTEVMMNVAETTEHSITDWALQHVTERALRDVTMCALLRVWCVVNTHCKVEGNDAILAPLSVWDLDEIAGISGFGEILERVGWVLERDPKTLIFHNFLEFNEPTCMRRAPKTNAERQRVFREKMRNENRNDDGVTQRNESNARLEEIREEYIPIEKEIHNNSTTEANSVLKEKKSTQRAKRLVSSAPLVFVLDKSHRDWAVVNDINVDLEIETEKFLDHHRAKGNTFKDWSAAWRKWMRSAVEYARKNGTYNQNTRSRGAVAERPSSAGANRIRGEITFGQEE